MSEKKYRGRAECPFRVCVTASQPSPLTSHERLVEDEKEIDVACPLCATKMKGRIGEEGK